MLAKLYRKQRFGTKQRSISRAVLVLQAQKSGQLEYDSEDSSAWSHEEEMSWELEKSESGESDKPQLQLPEEDTLALGKADAGTLTPTDKERLVRAAGLSLPEEKGPQMPMMWYGVQQPP